MAARAPYIALLEVTIRLAAFSLKDKRMVVRSLTDGVRRRFGVTAAEVDGLDDRRLAVIAIAGLAAARPQADSLLAKVEDYVEREFGHHDLSFESRVTTV
jgi:uncharacterized protein YlxP (DUF503 family)